MDKSGANLAALQAINAERETPIKVGQVKYLNNIVEQDHRAIKRRIRPMRASRISDVPASSSQALRQCT
jgi:putative transposase